jgi:Tol biopolymer transport system component
MNMKKICMFLALLMVRSMVISAQDMFPVRQLTTDPTQDGLSTWSPDGRSVAYQRSDMYDDTLGKNGLWKVTVDGTGAKGKALQGKN